MQRLARTWFPRLALVAVLALASLVAVSGNTQARYVSDTAHTSDSARVAKWGTLTVDAGSTNFVVLDENPNDDNKRWTATYEFTVSDVDNEVAVTYDIELNGLFSNTAVDVMLDQVDASGATKEIDTETAAVGVTSLTFKNAGTFAPGGGSQKFLLTLSIDGTDSSSVKKVTVSANAQQVD
jgi:hypothetical protein